MLARGGFVPFSLKEGNTRSSSFLYGVSRRQLIYCASWRFPGSEPFKGFYGTSFVLPPEVTHGVWIEMFQR